MVPVCGGEFGAVVVLLAGWDDGSGTLASPADGHLGEPAADARLGEPAADFLRGDPVGVSCGVKVGVNDRMGRCG